MIFPASFRCVGGPFHFSRGVFFPCYSVPPPSGKSPFYRSPPQSLKSLVTILAPGNCIQLPPFSLMGTFFVVFFPVNVPMFLLERGSVEWLFWFFSVFFITFLLDQR